jgi:21S rRNA (GM2251-2'-O)-methyltransferase
VLAALSCGRRDIYEVFVMEGWSDKNKKDAHLLRKVQLLAEGRGVTVTEMNKHDMNLLSEHRPHQGLALDVGPLELVQLKGPPSTLRSMLLPSESSEPPESFDVQIAGRPPLWLILDQVTDPQNLGALLRTAYFLGLDGVGVCAKNSAPLSATVSKASAGALEVMTLHEIGNLPKYLTACVEKGWTVLGAEAGDDATEVREMTVRQPTVVVMGSEGFGLRPLVRHACSGLVRIDGGMLGVRHGEFEVDSLNVSVAAGIMLHHLSGSREIVR